MNKVKLSLITLGLILAALLLGACQTINARAPGVPATGPETTNAGTAAPETTVDYIGSFSVNPSHAPIGATVNAAGQGFEPDTDLELAWQGFHGSWKVGEGAYEGREYKEDIRPLTEVRTDAGGSFETTFTVPDGFGFSHDVLVKKQNTIQNKSNFVVDMEVTMSPASGPVGTVINIEARGIGWRSLENSWTLLYDNKFTGWISSVTTDGAARVKIPAAGTPGKHIIQIIHGSFTFPYMNMQQSPQSDRPSWTFEFTVTGGAAVQPPPAVEQSLPPAAGLGKPDAGTPALGTDISSGTVGTPFTIYGSGLPAGEPVELRWFKVVGNRVSGQGWSEDSSPLGTVTAGPDGTIELPVSVPDDLGGPHRIEAQVDGEKIADTSLTITPSAAALSPASGPVGTVITIHLKGVGWTETANIYNIVYDNAYTGYACGFNSQGDVTVYLPAAGEPGWHYIDLYPGIYKGSDISGLNNFRIPQLTAVDDHPGEQLPVFRFAFLVTE